MKRQSGGTPWIGILTIIFVVLKLTGNIDWSWWLVLSPSIFGLAIGVFVMAVAAIAFAATRD